MGKSSLQLQFLTSLSELLAKSPNMGLGLHVGVTSQFHELLLHKFFVGWLMVKSGEQHLRCITVNIKNETCIVNSEHEQSINYCRISSINRTMLSFNLIIGLLMFFSTSDVTMICAKKLSYKDSTRLRFRVRFLEDPTLNRWVPLMHMQTGIWKWGRFTTFNSWKISCSRIVWVLSESRVSESLKKVQA